MNHYFTDNTDLKSEIRHLKYEIEDVKFDFISDIGVFSKDKVDYGTKLLISTYLENKKEPKRILDVGCGTGIIGIVLSKICSAKSTMVDVNKRCVHLTERNIKNNEVDAETFISNCYDEIEGKYDLIITNPPIRAGKKIVDSILLNAKDYLNKDGELWCVIRKDAGAKTFIKTIKPYYEVEIMNKSKGFYIIKAKVC